jgi:hypothetical protein
MILLLYDANAYDNQFASKKPNHNVFMHRIDVSDDDIHYDYISYNSDAPVSTLLANSTERCNKSFGSNIKNGVRIQRDKLFNLDTKSKEIWDQLDDKSNSIILGYDTRGSNSSFTPPKGGSKTNLLPQLKINLHDMSSYDLLQVYASYVNHPTSEMEELDDEDDNTNETPPDIPSVNEIPGLSVLLLLAEIVNFHPMTFVVSFQKLQNNLSTNVNI